MCPKFIELLSWNGPTVHVCCFMLARASTKTFVSRIHIRQPGPKNSGKNLLQPKNSLARSLVSRDISVRTYLLTPCCRVLHEKLTGLQLVKKFPAFHGTRRFIIALTSVRHLSLSWVSPFQSIYPHPTSWKSILMLSTHRDNDLYG